MHEGKAGRPAAARLSCVGRGGANILRIFCTGLEAPLLAGALFGRNLRRGAEPPPWSGIQEKGEFIMQAIVETLFDAVYLISVIAIGMLMIPKTCACVWTVLIG